VPQLKALLAELRGVCSRKHQQVGQAPEDRCELQLCSDDSCLHSFRVLGIACVVTVLAEPMQWLLPQTLFMLLARSMLFLQEADGRCTLT
jgi:hypothetical protein